MKAIKEYIYATMMADNGVDGIRTKATGGISYSFPEGAAIDWSKPRVTFFLSDWTPVSDSRAQPADQYYQFDIWSRNPDTNDELAGRIDALFVDQPMNAFNRRVDAVKNGGEHELYEEDVKVHHKVKFLRVISFPTT